MCRHQIKPHTRSTRTYPVNMVPEDVGVDHGDGFQGHERDEANYPGYYQGDIFLWQTDWQLDSGLMTITHYNTATIIRGCARYCRLIERDDWSRWSISEEFVVN